MTTTRSPFRITSSPPGSVIESWRMIARTRESFGILASRRGRSTIAWSAPSGISNSTIWTWPSAKTSVWRAAGMPTERETACAVSISDDTAKSTSSRPSRQRSMYSTLDARITIVARGASRRPKEQATRFTSSRDVQAMNRSALPVSAPRIALRLAPFASMIRTSKRYASRSSRSRARSITVTSCSPCNASTMVEPTCPAPTMTIFTPRGSVPRLLYGRVTRTG